MEAKNDSIQEVDQFHCWVGATQLNAQIFVPSELEGLVLVAYPGPMEGAESYVSELAYELRRERLGTVLLNGTPDAHRYEDQRSGLRRYLPSLLRARIAGVLGRLRGHERYGRLPLGCIGLGPCAAPVLGAGEVFEGQPEAAVAIGGRPAQATELTETVTAPTLILDTYAQLEGDVGERERFKEMFEDARSEVRLLAAEPPFAGARAVAQTVALATNWFHDHLTPTRPRRPNLTAQDPTASPRFGLPPMPSLLSGRESRRSVRA